MQKLTQYAHRSIILKMARAYRRNRCGDQTVRARAGRLLVEENNPMRAGDRASKSIAFGSFGRYRLFAVHTRFGAISWFVRDAETVDPVCGGPATIRQEPTIAEALKGFWLPYHPLECPACERVTNTLHERGTVCGGCWRRAERDGLDAGPLESLDQARRRPATV